MASNTDVPEGFRPADLPSPFVVENGPLYWKDEDGKLVFGLRIEKRHTNAADTAHGGLIMTMIDMQMNMAINYQCKIERFIPTVSANVDFISAAPLGSWMEGRTEILRQGKRTVFTDCRITLQDGTLVARGAGVFTIPHEGQVGELILDDMFY